MRNRFLVALVSFAALVACQDNTLAPADSSLDFETSELVPDYAVSPAAVIDGAGIGASRLPEDIQLTAEQKAQIAALHEAFMKDNAADITALKQLEEELRAARRSGAARDQLRVILERAHPIQERLAAAFKRLQEAIWAVYTPAQRAWIESHRPKLCDRNGAPRLSEEQIQKIRALQEAFQAAIAADIAFIKQVNQQARAAKEAGKSREEVAAIFATALPAMERVRVAERKLHEDILAVLTPEQRAAWCLVGRSDAPPRKP